ncbi:MAG: carbohydrate ABC transporter permease [Eubacteriales bacterium]|nr:carbohydrate ABC transporter permease [Eubacteriales bacterium]
MKERSVIVKENRTSVIVLILAFALICTLLCLPAYEFTSSIYTKKSGNTFVGDEKYVAVKAEVEAVAEDYRADGIEVTLKENVIERTNSKGKTTSMVSFSLDHTFTKSGWSFINSGLTSSWVLLGIILCSALSCACGLAGIVGSMGDSYNRLDGRSAAFRSASGYLALFVMLLVPVFFMMNTFAMSRQVKLFTSETITDGADEFYALLNAFLFDGTAGDNISSALSGLTFKNTYAAWGILPCAFAMMLAAISLRRGTIGHTFMRGLLYAFVIVMCVFILYPYYVMLVTGLRSSAEANDMYFLHIFPTEWRFENLKYIMGRGIPKYLLNSLLIAGGATCIALLCGIPAAFAMARMKFKGRNAFLGFVIMSQMFSPVVLLIGIAQLMSALKLNDSLVGLMLINAAFNQAFAIWLLRGTFVSISSEMEQAAKIDGCNTVQSLVKILIPMAAPGIVTTLIFVFINAWNEYTISTILISTAANRPITVGITQFSSFNMIEWQYLFASSLLATVPVVILFMCIEKHLTSGLTAGGVKG